MSQDKLKNKPVDPEIVRPDTPHPDEVIHVPKGSSKTRFLMTFLLVILVLTTFSVTGPLMDVLGGRDKSFATYMTWKTPGGEDRAISHKKFQENKNAYLLVNGIVQRRNAREITDEEVAAFLVEDDAAERAGIRTPDSSVAEFLKRIFGTSATYNEVLHGNRTNSKDFEAMVKRMMRVERFRQLQTEALSVPDPAAVEKLWRGRHQEYAFDYVEQPVAGMMDAARAQAPKGDDLKAWFDARPDAEKEAYKTKPQVSAELVGFSLEGPWSADALLAKYPRPAGEDAEKVARDYVDGFGFIRFPKVPTSRTDTNHMAYEDVKEKALAEAPVYNALMDWVADMKKREAAGEKIDLAAEATALGLSYRKQSEPHDRDAWKEVGINFVGRITMERLFEPDTKPNTLFAAIQVDEKAFVYGRVLESIPAKMPEFSAIEASVTDKWADQKARELAVAKLADIKKSFVPASTDATAAPAPAEADAAKFKEVVEAAGLTVQHRDWMERAAPMGSDEKPGELYIRSTPILYTQPENRVVDPALNREGTMAYLVRVGGVRDPDVAKMKPVDLASASREAVQSEQRAFSGELFSRDSLQARYHLDLQSWHDEKKQAAQ
jgi:hypothetical protein